MLRGFALFLALWSGNFAAADTTGAVIQPAVQGVWKTDCVPIGKNGRHGFITRLEIIGDAVVATAQIYAHNSCDTPTVHVDYRGKLVSLSQGGNDLTDFDHVVESLTMTADLPDVVETYNAGNPGSGCGLAGSWQLRVARAVDGRTCAPWTFPAAGVRLYERAWVAGDELRLGSFPGVWDNITSGKRPTTPGTLLFHRAIE